MNEIKEESPILYNFFESDFSYWPSDIERLFDAATQTGESQSKDAFNVFCFARICLKYGDQEDIARYCIAALRNSPLRHLTYMSEDPQLFRRMSLFVGFELYFSERQSSMVQDDFQSFSSYLLDATEGCPELREITDEFLLAVKKTMESMD